MKKSFKIAVFVLVAAFVCMVPSTASAKGPRLSFSLNIGAFPFCMPAPVPVVQQRVYVQPVYPYPPYPPCYQERTIVREYYYPRFAYPTPPAYGYPIYP